ncbi:MAG TPA: hypothetical protein PLP19_12985 [bacterium]|nr:hypothetical protein [bacterium]HPN44401.1 hypothetical protein [bacterium]
MLELFVNFSFIISILSILISIFVTGKEKGKGSSKKLKKLIIISLILALVSTLINGYANKKISKNNDNQINTLKNDLSTLIDSVEIVNNKYKYTLLLLDSSKNEIKKLRYFAPPAYNEIDNKSLFQNGKFVGVFNKYSKKKQSSIIVFDEIKNADNFDILEPFLFDTYVLKIKDFQGDYFTTSNRKQDGRILENVSCVILKKH